MRSSGTSFLSLLVRICTEDQQAVQISTGDVVYDDFEDGPIRAELETRLQHLQPSEILIPNMTFTKATESILRTHTLKR